MSLAHLELLPLHWSSGECLKVIESVAVPVKGHLGFQLPSISSGQMDRVLADFHWQMLDVVGTPLPCPGPLGLDPSLFMGDLQHQGVPSGVQPLSVGLRSIILRLRPSY